MAYGALALLDHLKPDAVLFIDGGVDSLMRGDESEVGTLFEDVVSLAAVSQLPASLPRYLAYLGMGVEDDIAYASVWENIAALAGTGGFLGGCALTAEMAAYGAYENAVNYVHAQKHQQPSVINSSIVSAVRGHYGDYHAPERTKNSRLHISPLMSLYWFFDLPAVAQRSLIVPRLISTGTRREALERLALTRALAQSRRGGVTPRPT